MKTINDIKLNYRERPIKVLQFGEGNFLRAFVDYMIDIANEKGAFDGNVAIVKPIPFGNIESFKAQNCKYTVVLRGRQDSRTVDESRIITSVSAVYDAAESYNEWIALASSVSLRFVVSNTTEAGIAFDPDDRYDGLPESYPGKLTKFLYERYKAFNGASDSGLIILPVELIENNGGRLRECVLKLCECWSLPSGFCDWIKVSCVFCSTLVDRIVTGFPRKSADAICARLGYTDKLLDVGEPFALWVIESEKDISRELPLDKAGLPVIFTDNQKPYRERKVRILNGAHTSSVLAGYLCGLDIVRECMHDPDIGRLIRRTVNNEIAPFVPLPREETLSFASSVFERFENPFIDHKLLSISLNSVSKWKARVLPSFKDCFAENGELPPLLTFSFAALLAFYRSDRLTNGGLTAQRPGGEEYTVHDSEEVLECFTRAASKSDLEYTKAIASNTGLWGEDLTAYPKFAETAANWLNAICSAPREAVKKILEETE